MKDWLRSLNEYWFGYGSPVAIGVFRALIGLWALVNFAMLAWHWDAFFTDRGYFPTWMAERWAAQTNVPKFMPLMGDTSGQLALVVFGIAIVASIFTMIGLFSRISVVVLFLSALALHTRTIDLIHGGDNTLRNLLFFLMFAPSGAAFSVDRLLAVRRGTAPAELPLMSLWPQRMITFQLAIIYLMTAWLKATGNTWRDGTATYFPAHLHEFDRFPVPAFVDQQPFVMMTTYGTLALELALGTLVFAPQFRKWILILGLLMHGYIEYAYNIPLFALIICSGYVCFYRGEEVQAWWDRVAPKLQARGIPVRTRFDAKPEASHAT